MASVHGQNFSWTYQKVIKKNTRWILSFKRTSSHISLKSGISLLLLQREQTKNYTIFFQASENRIFSFRAFLATILSLYVYIHISIHIMRLEYQTCYFKTQGKTMTEGFTITVDILVVNSSFFFCSMI